MRKISFLWLWLIPWLSLSQTLLDQASHYQGNWSHGSNQGNGFGAWVISSAQQTGHFIGNPSNDGMETSGIGSTAFGLFAKSSTNYASAYRPFSTALGIGDQFSFFWAMNWNANTGNKGFDIRSGNTTVFNVNNSDNSRITSSAGTASTDYGVIPMKVTLTRMSATEYLLQMSRRFTDGGDFFAVFTHTGPINGIHFYVGAQGSPESQRNIYFNRLQITKNAFPQGVPNFVLYKWSGALTPTSIRVNAKLARQSSKSRLIVSSSPDLTQPLMSPFISVNQTTNFMGTFEMQNLSPNTTYYYAIESHGIIDQRPEAVGKFKTPQAGPHSFSFTAGACNRFYTHPVFEKIREKNPLFMLVTGDLHYRDPNSTNVNVHRMAYERDVLSMGLIRSLYNEIPIAYVWDDHDFSGDDSNAFSIGAESAKQAYREYVPHYPFGTGLVNQNSAIYQSFVIGRVRFIMTDLRSESTPNGHMSAQQLQWFKNECLAAKNANQMICWVSSFGITSHSNDSWGGSLEFRQQRSDIFSFLNQSNIQNLFIVSGDAHAIGIDDGENTDCAGVTATHQCPRDECSWNPRYPLFHCGPLGNNFSSKGVITNILPMSGMSQIGQYGKISVIDNGGSDISITFTAYRVSPNSGTESVLANYTFTRNLQATDETLTLVPQKAIWKYLDNGSAQGESWKNLGFNDRQWSTGQAPLGYGMPGVQTEISFGSSPKNKHITTYFRKTFTLTGNETPGDSQLMMWLDDGAVAYVNGVEVAKANFNHQIWNFQTLATTLVTNQPMRFRFCFSDLPLVVGENVLAVEVHQYSPSSSDKFFDAEIIGRIDNTLSATDPSEPSSKNTHFKVFPNPTSGKITLLSEYHPQRWNVYQVDGKLLKKGKWNSSSKTLELDLSDLQEALYIIELDFGKTKQQTKVKINRS